MQLTVVSKQFIILSLMGVLTIPSTIEAQIKPQLAIKEVVEKFEKAVQQKDTALLSGVVAGDFSVSTSSWPNSARLLTLAWNTKSIEEIKLLSDKPVKINNNKQKIKVSIREKDKEPVETFLFLNKENQVLYVDYIDQLFGKNRYGESTLRVKLPIELTETGSIHLKIKINDQPRILCFLFDSGADGMAISKELADTLGMIVSHNKETSVVGGNMNVSISTDNTVHLDTLALAGQSFALFDKMKDGVDGIIGLNIAKEFIAKFDLDNRELSLFDFGTYKYEPEGKTIAITVPQGISMIPGSLNLTGTGFIDGQFAFDTGANYYLIGFSPFVRKNKLLTSGFAPDSQYNTVSMGKVTPTFNGHCRDFKVDDFHLKEMPVALQAGSNWDAGADGSLGVKFISRFNFTINLLEKEIHLTPNKRTELPIQ